MKIEMWLTSKVIPYANNPRINDHAVELLAASIRTYGWRQPIVVDVHGNVIVGHLRLKAAIHMGLTEVPVHVATDLSSAQVKAYRIADNKLSEQADWDFTLLSAELAVLQLAEIDISLLGFSPDELTKILGDEARNGECDPDEIPAPPDQAITQRGDMWVLDKHRLLCGDSSDSDQVDRLLGGQLVHLVNTDPPYNVNAEPRSNNAMAAGLSSFGKSYPRAPGVTLHSNQREATTSKLRARDRPLAGDFVSEEEYDQQLDAWFCNISRVLLPGRAFYIWGGYANLGNYPPVLKRHGLYFSQSIVWDKQHPVLTRKDFMGCFELAFYGWREGSAHEFFGPNNALDLWHVKKVSPQSMVHLTEKPVELAARAMQYSSRPGENVLDLFGGSGSTMIAAEQLGRRAFLMELDTLYCDVIVQRFEKFTGKKATHYPAEALTDGAVMPQIVAPATDSLEASS